MGITYTYCMSLKNKICLITHMNNIDKYLWFQTAAKWLKTAIFWVIAQWLAVISYQCFGTTYRSNSQGSRNSKDSWTPRIGQIGCPQTSVTNYHYSKRNNQEQHSSKINIYSFGLFCCNNADCNNTFPILKQLVISRTVTGDGVWFPRRLPFLIGSVDQTLMTEITWKEMDYYWQCQLRDPCPKYGKWLLIKLLSIK